MAKQLNKNIKGPFFTKTKISSGIYEIKKKRKSLRNLNIKAITKYIVKAK